MKTADSVTVVALKIEIVSQSTIYYLTGKSQPTPISFVRGLFSVAFCTDIKYFSLSSNSLFWEKEQSTAHSQTRGEKSPSQQKQSEDN